MTRPAGPLQERREAARRAELTHEIDGPDVDAELERGGGDEHVEVARAQAVLDAQPALLREASVVGRHLSVAEPFLEHVGEAFGETAGVREDERRMVFPREGRDSIDDLRPLLVRRDGLELARGNFDGDVERAAVTDVDDVAGGLGVGLAGQRRARGSHEQACNDVDRLLCRRQADAGGSLLAERVQPGQGQREVGSALVARHRVDLVDDHRAHAFEGCAAALGGDQEIQRLGGRDQDVGRAAHHRGARGLGCIAASHLRSNGG